MDTLAEIRLYDLGLFVHVAAVVVGFGPTFAYPFFQATVERLSPRSVPAMFRAMHASSRYLVTPGLLVVLASGLYLTIDGWDFDEPFVVVGLSIVVALMILWSVLLRPPRGSADRPIRERRARGRRRRGSAERRVLDRLEAFPSSRGRRERAGGRGAVLHDRQTLTARV